MKTKFYHPVLFFLAISLIMITGDIMAQGCVQCRMVPAADLKNGGTAAGNVNSAILYLMTVPYLLLVSIAVYVFRKQLKEKWYQLKGRAIS
jgi:hypothetical protein